MTLGNGAMHVPGDDMQIPQAVMPAMSGVATYMLNKYELKDLRDDVEGIISASDFIEMTNNAQLLFI